MKRNKNVRSSVPPLKDTTQIAKLEALGRLSGGIAHDVNNVLASIMTLASTIKLDLVNGKVPSLEDVDDILSSCRRGRDMTLALLGYARKGDVFKRPMSLFQEAENVRKILERVSAKDLTIRVSEQGEVPQISGDPSEIKNALMNLCINSVDAMGLQGCLDIRLSTKVFHEPWGGLGAGEYVVLEVVDNGEGMSQETLKRAFEPFFTTKPEGKGTGLGLSRVRSIVQDHGGKVEVESELKVGTTVRAYLPALALEHQDPGIKGSAPPLFAGHANILLVDDEPLVRKSGGRLLRKLGYTVFEAGNGQEAVEVIAVKTGEVDLVILDMIMPVMDGPTAFYRLRQIEPEMPVILCSGYSEDDAAGALLAETRVGFVQKPFSAGELSRQVAQMMGRRYETPEHPVAE